MVNNEEKTKFDVERSNKHEQEIKYVVEAERNQWARDKIVCNEIHNEEETKCSETKHFVLETHNDEQWTRDNLRCLLFSVCYLSRPEGQTTISSLG